MTRLSLHAGAVARGLAFRKPQYLPRSRCLIEHRRPPQNSFGGGYGYRSRRMRVVGYEGFGVSTRSSSLSRKVFALSLDSA